MPALSTLREARITHREYVSVMLRKSFDGDAGWQRIYSMVRSFSMSAGASDSPLVLHGLTCISQVLVFLPSRI
jgi:hypothetical protein